ncbi:alanine/glycine:cation symporter family protein [Adhaeretor mobilis]|uniref:Amino-acid carrier protein AlsT n=1 Tax=Adhaeretor mobilis TaxID=1930276 RepID=A0A517MX13_9BACT|nr:alanine/glycine:cation symporter family protein [Adhaeretor mobilis]QDS99413.1 Amino-acid carrier protein AlsT [Adhaeretor mobilis]
MVCRKSFFFFLLGTLLVLPVCEAFAQPDPEQVVSEPDLSFPEDTSAEEATNSAESPEDTELSFGDAWRANWDDAEKSRSLKVQDSINQIFDEANDAVGAVLLYELPIVPAYEDGKPRGVSVILLTLISGGLFFTLRYKFINVRLLGHCFSVIRGHFDDEKDEGEVSHFQALTSALSATVGLGNIAGVAVAITMGGSGAVFWMWVIAFLGMSLKFTSCSLAQYYRRVKPDGTVLGGPMVFLEDGFRDRLPKLALLGKVLAVTFAVLTILAAFGGGNMFQGNQAFSLLNQQFPKVAASHHAWIFGLLLAFLVGIVIIGGIRRIGEVTSKLVPFMCAFFCLVCLVIIIKNYEEVPAMFGRIFSEAFAVKSVYGGIFGALLTGAQRAAFSNEAGVGSAAIVHAAAKTDEPIREGVVAMIAPAIDTIAVCTMTALAILISSAHLDPVTGLVYGKSDLAPEGIVVTARAFASLGAAMPYLLCIAVCCFAYSTLISWSYYGERATEYLIGPGGILPYRIVYLIFVALGPILSLQSVIDFSDMMILSMAFPNIVGMVLLSGLISRKASDYTQRLKSGEMQPDR